MKDYSGFPGVMVRGVLSRVQLPTIGLPAKDLGLSKHDLSTLRQVRRNLVNPSL